MERKGTGFFLINKKKKKNIGNNRNLLCVAIFEITLSPQKIVIKKKQNIVNK